MDYQSSGVDIDAGNEVVRRIRSLAKGTFTPGVLSEIGSFGGLFSLASLGAPDAVLVASADGVGTKLKVAFDSGVHDTVGEDLVNHCVNDILVQGAEPLFFLDYLATGKLSPDVAVPIVGGMARACRANGCALLGGETAEMPGFYQAGEYDLAGFIVGAVGRDRMIDGKAIASGDAIVALPSSGLHTNGYSLARRIVFEHLGLTVSSAVAELGTTAGAALLAPHRSYLPVIRPLLGAGAAERARSHHRRRRHRQPAAGPARRDERRDRSRGWTVPPLFAWLVSAGGVPREDAWRTFNMGMGLLAVVAPPMSIVCSHRCATPARRAPPSSAASCPAIAPSATSTSR